MRRWLIACASCLVVPGLALAFSLVPVSAQSSPSPSASGSPATSASPGQGAGAVKGDPANGEQLFGQTCASCHGADLSGGVGPKLNPIENCGNTKNPLDVTYLTDVISNGLSGAKCSTAQGTQMPAKGGNSSLSDKDIADIIAFIEQSNHSKGPLPYSTFDLPRATVLDITIAILVMLFFTWLLAQYNMRWIARRAAARRERLERQGRL